MNSTLANRLKRKLQRELIKRKLTEFFVSKGCNNFEQPLYPPVVFDVAIKVPQLFTRCEVIPTVEETDTALGIIRLSWNLFVLGTNRLNLGSTTHVGQHDIVRAVAGEPNTQLPTEFVTTPKDVIEFILKILDNSKSGYVELPPNFQIPVGALDLSVLDKSRSPRLGPSSSGAFYAKRF